MKKFLALLLVLVIGIGAGIGGTVAYLTDNDSDVNVMTVGNVSIEQHEYERKVDADGNYVTDVDYGYVLKDFTQAKPLLPATEVDDNYEVVNFGAGGWDDTKVRMTQVDSYGYMDVFKSKDAQDKFVTVENTGKTDAYVRTLVAIEVGSADPDLIGTSYHGTWTKNEIGTVEIDGNKYYLYEYVYAGGELSDGSWRHKNGVLPAGDTSYPSLAQVYLQAKATNEDMVKIDGNGNGTLDILVLSQAVQVANFDNAEQALTAAFGEVTVANVQEWFGGEKIPVVVDTAKELQNALKEDKDVVLTDNVMVSAEEKGSNGYGATGISVKEQTFDGAGHEIGVDAWATWDSAISTTGGTIKNVKVTRGMRGIFMPGATADVYIDNVVIDGTVYTFNSDAGNKEYGVYISNSILNGWTSHSDVHKEVVYTNCEFGEGQGYAYCRPYGPTTFVGCDFEAGFKVDAVGKVVFENCTIGGVALTAENLSTLVTSDTIANASVK